jgi:hypothetical protein
LAAISYVQGVAYAQITRLVREDQNITKAITNLVLSTNVATLTVGSGHGFSVGQTVKVTDVDSTFNGTYVITATATTTISYVCVALNVSSTSVGGAAAATALIVGDIICTTNEIPETNYETDVDLTLTGGILS